jgi:4-hydroxy-2-oxoheptanedioate aldolase
VRMSRVKRRWAQGKPVLATVAHFRDPQSAELIGLLGFDCLWIDLEHQPTGISEAENMTRAARGCDMDVMARAAKGEFMRAARLLEAGVNLLMYPRCESAQEARDLMKAIRFPPLGERGYFSASPDNPYCLTSMAEYLKQANEQTVLVVQIESPNAVAQAAEIAAVDGVDMLFFGPGDFSVLSGTPGDFHAPVARAALESTAKAALAAGKRFGTLVFDLDHAKQALDVGATLLCYGGDLHFVRQALTRVKQDFGKLGFTFGEMAHRGGAGGANYIGK